MHQSTFEYLKPTDDQTTKMGFCRNASKDYADVISMHMPDGPDKTYALRKLREVAMWVNVAITRNPDGTPRS